MVWTDAKAYELFEKLAKKAEFDSALRARLLKNPKAAIEEAAGEKIPDDFKINVIEADPAYDMTFVMPPALDPSLSDEDLEKVAGGGDCNTYKCSTNK